MLRTTRLLPLLILILAACDSRPAAAQSTVLYEKKSAYNEILVRQNASGVRELLFEKDGAIQSALDTNQPDRLVLEYTRTSMTALAAMPNPKRILIIGLGGGSMPMFLRRAYPETHIDVAELDPDVADVARRFFGFVEDAHTRIHVGDGRKFIENSTDRYDLIFLDAYGPDSIPYALATREFLLVVRNHLSETGIVASNIWSYASNLLYHDMLKTYWDIFDEVHIIKGQRSNNHIIIALPRKADLSKARLIQAAAEVQPRMPKLNLADMIRRGYSSAKDLPDNAQVLRDK